MSELKLEVGNKYRTRDGQEVKVIHKMNTRLHPFVGDNGCTFKDDGMWLYTQEMDEDLVEEIIEPKLKLEVGKKYRTRGGDVATVVELKDPAEYYPYTVHAQIDQIVLSFTLDGRYYSSTDHSDFDLIEEVTEPQPKQQEIRPMFDKKYKYVAMDRDSYSKLFLVRPSIYEHNGCWHTDGYAEVVVGTKVFNLGDDWKESLREIVYNDDGSIYLCKPRHEFKVDDKVLVRNVGDSSWTRRHFCRYSEEGYIECYSSGYTSFTVNDTVIWDEIKPYEDEGK